MSEPPPVRLVAVEDVHLPGIAGLEAQLDDFYLNILQFIREQADPGQIAYKAENRRLIFSMHQQPPTREDFHIIGIEVPSLSLVQQQLIDREIEYQWLRGLTPGQDQLLVRDPAGNWIQIGQFKLL